MIEEPPALTIRRNFERPPRQSVEALRGVPTAFVVDAMEGRGALAHDIEPLKEQVTATMHLVGTALTCRCGPADNLALFAAVTVAQAGDIVVAATDRFEATCVTGDQLLGLLKKRGAIGFVTDGLVRDVGGILRVAMPIFCRGVTPNAPVANGPGTVGLDITVAGVGVASGDVVVADRDGIAVVPAGRLSEILDRVGEIRKLESEMDARVNEGKGLPEPIQKALDRARTRYVD